MKKTHSVLRSIRMLNHFLAASRAGNIHRAAKELALTQSALSKSIRQLEEELGVALFERSSRGVRLTRFGEVLYERAARIETECNLIEREMAEMAQGRRGNLRIAAGAVWSSVLLPRVLSRLHAKRPSAQFTMIRSSGPRFADLFADGRIDIALGSLDSFSSANDSFICEPLSEFETLFLAHRDHALHRNPEVALKDLAECSLSMFRLDPELVRRVGTLFATNGLPRPQPILLADSLTSVLEMLRSSGNITCLPSPLLSIAEPFGVIPLPIDLSPWTFQSGVMFRRTGLHYPLLADMLAILREEYGSVS
ncbi:MAG: LysR family transcriptional regulator [Albidovulum sp.]|nr:LysR family transcriptional regulator [Albidovulum sp.]MDE0531543.1 LysR family transcriptional regulator [Albidovulum sp.]